jgi:hypothetical protein
MLRPPFLAYSTRSGDFDRVERRALLSVAVDLGLDLYREGHDVH